MSDNSVSTSDYHHLLFEQQMEKQPIIIDQQQQQMEMKVKEVVLLSESSSSSSGAESIHELDDDADEGRLKNNLSQKDEINKLLNAADQKMMIADNNVIVVTPPENDYNNNNSNKAIVVVVPQQNELLFVNQQPPYSTINSIRVTEELSEEENYSSYVAEDEMDFEDVRQNNVYDALERQDKSLSTPLLGINKQTKSKKKIKNSNYTILQEMVADVSSADNMSQESRSSSEVDCETPEKITFQNYSNIAAFVVELASYFVFAKEWKPYSIEHPSLFQHPPLGFIFFFGIILLCKFVFTIINFFSAYSNHPDMPTSHSYLLSTINQILWNWLLFHDHVHMSILFLFCHFYWLWVIYVNYKPSQHDGGVEDDTRDVKHWIRCPFKMSFIYSMYLVFYTISLLQGYCLEVTILGVACFLLVGISIGLYRGDLFSMGLIMILLSSITQNHPDAFAFDIISSVHHSIMGVNTLVFTGFVFGMVKRQQRVVDVVEV